MEEQMTEVFATIVRSGIKDGEFLFIGVSPEHYEKITENPQHLAKLTANLKMAGYGNTTVYFVPEPSSIISTRMHVMPQLAGVIRFIENNVDAKEGEPAILVLREAIKSLQLETTIEVTQIAEGSPPRT